MTNDEYIKAWEEYDRKTADTYLGTFIMKVELGNAAMQSPDDLASALELVAVQVRNRMEYPMPVLDANGNACGEWTVLSND